MNAKPQRGDRARLGRPVGASGIALSVTRGSAKPPPLAIDDRPVGAEKRTVIAPRHRMKHQPDSVGVYTGYPHSRKLRCPSCAIRSLRSAGSSWNTFFL